MEPAAETRAPSDRSSSPGWGSTPSPTSPSFASLLASLAARAGKPSSAGNDDGLEDDIATLSYERALRTHTRFGSTAHTDRSLTQAASQGPIQGPIRVEETFEATAAPSSQPAVLPDASRKAAANPEAEPSRPWSAPLERNLKDASITIRMSKAECEQLRRRASEAGLTVSAYLRSCTIEAESLRAMVKDTMAQLRSAAVPAEPANPARPRHSRFRGLARLLTPWQGSPRVTRA